MSADAEVNAPPSVADGDALRQGLRRLILIQSAPRSGSSMLAGFLRRTAGLLSLQGEVTPFLIRAGLYHPFSGTDSDRLDADHASGEVARLLGAELAGEVGYPSTLRTKNDRAAFAALLLRRLSFQWPTANIPPGLIAATIEEIHGRRELDTLVPQSVLSDLHCALLHRLRSAVPEIDPWYYDISPERLSSWWPGTRPAEGPAGELLGEVTPFILAMPWRRATAREWATVPLVMKTPANAYRLPFWRAFFPNAEIHVLHLTRDPAASVRSLMNGWRYRGFFSHRCDVPLDIAGYSDDQRPWTRAWWNFDLVPSWRNLTQRPLETVCASQWTLAHAAILAARDHCDSYLRITYEELTGSAVERMRAIGKLTSWLRTGCQSADAARPMPKEIIAYGPSCEPDETLLKEALNHPLAAEVCDLLDYGHDLDSGEER